MSLQHLALDNVQTQDPTDLMSIKELCLKHSYDYNYLYKWAILKGAINVYFRGTWKLSESEVKEFIKIQQEMKLSKIKARNKGDK
ncbi:MAG: hypothetical protein NC200_08385 [Candidatus Gastranaerophilales bacterium]|nr:hypothetical protein [Candidatus Gastranaerophilales bacterium]